MFLFLSLFIVVALACDLSVTVAPPTSSAPLSANTLLPAVENPTTNPVSATSIPVTDAPIVSQSSSEGVQVFFGSLQLVLPTGLASGISGSQYSRSEELDVAPWEVTPGHTQLKLEGYLLQGKFHKPQVFVYPAQGYGEMYPGAFESLQRMNNILGGLPFSNDQPKGELF